MLPEFYKKPDFKLSDSCFSVTHRGKAPVGSGPMNQPAQPLNQVWPGLRSLAIPRRLLLRLLQAVDEVSGRGSRQPRAGVESAHPVRQQHENTLSTRGLGSIRGHGCACAVAQDRKLPDLTKWTAQGDARPRDQWILQINQPYRRVQAVASLCQPAAGPGVR